MSEGLNSQIQKIKRMACGLRNIEHFKTAIYFHCGGLDLYLCWTRERQRSTSPPSCAIIRVQRGEKEIMDEMEEGKQKFLEVVQGIDGSVQVVIPVTPSNSMFLISLTKGPNRKFITVPEDDIIDLPHEASIRTKVTKTVKDAIAAL